jgi:hypothetical protein
VAFEIRIYSCTVRDALHDDFLQPILRVLRFGSQRSNTCDVELTALNEFLFGPKFGECNQKFDISAARAVDLLLLGKTRALVTSTVISTTKLMACFWKT